MKILLLIGLLGCLVSVTATANAQQVWRCGADGRSFSDQPCKQGTSLEPLRPRPAADVQAAAERGQQNASLAESMRQERLQRERLPPLAKPTRAKKNAAARADTHLPHKVHKKKLKRSEAAGTFRATAPGSRRNPD